MRRAVVAISVVAWAGGWGCAALIGIQDTKDDQADGISPDAARDGREDTNVNDAAFDSASTDAAIDGDAGPTCPGIHGPKMVRVTAGFCVDATEVTRGDYAAFMATSPATGGQGVECSFNTSYAPADWPYQPDADLAIAAGVNWCDAVAYCKWAGKRLCGSRGDGGPVPIAKGSDPAVSEWASACSHQGTRTFAYGNTYEATRCNGSGYGGGRVVRAAELTNCQGGDPGIFDMSGNAWEWDYTCVLDDAGHPKQCGQRGGSYTDDSTLLVCALMNYQNLVLMQDSSGFRCCAD